ncbi:hypothetical protein J1N35_025606 [Gossypium stocksii]|uniref:Uncharacterized protein n=1 Tax=Gossypium stocksii TaxID=47602 RepID=A0A9D3ZYF3_9ROSI|nr:hypothetical protein J1N35_025606 [Gossypium stocksii]
MDEKSVFNERSKAQEENHQAEFERLRQSHNKSFMKYQDDTQKNLIEALSERKSNLILHAQVVIGHFDLSKGEEWEAFQRKWKQSVVFSNSTTTVATDNEGNLANAKHNPEGCPQSDEVPVGLVDQPTEWDN